MIRWENDANTSKNNIQKITKYPKAQMIGRENNDKKVLLSNSDDQLLSTQRNIIVNILRDSDSRQLTLPEVSVQQLPEPNIIVNKIAVHGN